MPAVAVCLWALLIAPCAMEALVFDPISTLHVWLTVSALANKDPNNAKALVFRQIELNWINAPLDDDNDYLALYLDSEPQDDSLPVSVHRLNGQTSGHIVTDYYLPQLEFLNSTHGGQSSEARANFVPLELEHEGWSPHRHNLYFAAGRKTVHQAQQDHFHSATEGEPTRQAPSLEAECIGYCVAYHSRGRVLARDCLQTRPNWMRDSFHYIEARPLPSLMLPGTHNSATYQHKLDKSALSMINKYQVNQDENIFNQLVYGIRHLDLRVGYSRVKQRPERLWVYHDIFRTEVSLDEVFVQVRRFLEMTSHEIVVVDFHRFTVGFEHENVATQRERHAQLIELLLERLGAWLVPSYLGQHAPIGELVGSGKRLVIGYASRQALLGQNGDSLLFGLLEERNQRLKQEQRPRDVDAPAQDADSASSAELSSELVESIQHRFKETPPAPDNNNNNNNNYNDQDSPASAADEDHNPEQADRRAGARLFNKLKTFKLISKSFSKRSLGAQTFQKLVATQRAKQVSAAAEPPAPLALNEERVNASVSRAALFFPPVRHLWPNRDTLEGLSQYMNTSTCRKHFGELRSMMVELTPTVFGAISDKYDGSRKLAQLVNRPVSDWIRDRWLHCLNIVASDFFLGNDLISLSIYANKMRLVHRGIQLGSAPHASCTRFRKIEHLLDKSKIPIQFAYHSEPSSSSSWPAPAPDVEESVEPGQLITHTGADGSRIVLRPLSASSNTIHRSSSGGGGGGGGGGSSHQQPDSAGASRAAHARPSQSGGAEGASGLNAVARERRDSIVENVAEAIADFMSSFKRLLNF